MKLIDVIIQNREQILALVAKDGVTTLKLYGSALVKKETAESDIDFVAFFDETLPYDWEMGFNAQMVLEAYFSRRVGIVDARRIPYLIRPSIEIDPVDIMELTSDKQYSITPKTSELYYIMLDRMFKDIDGDDWGTSDGFYFVADRLGWWFGRLLRLSDNDLKEYSGFYYVEVLSFCYKLNIVPTWDYKDEELKRFQELLEEVRKYVQLRLESQKAL